MNNSNFLTYVDLRKHPNVVQHVRNYTVYKYVLTHSYDIASWWVGGFGRLANRFVGGVVVWAICVAVVLWSCGGFVKDGR